MAYDEGLGQQVRDQLGRHDGLLERKMFGGLCFMLNGNMCCGVTGNDLMLRVGPDRYADAIARDHAREMDFTGKSLKGFVYVGPEGQESDDEFASWVQMAVDFALSLPPK